MKLALFGMDLGALPCFDKPARDGNQALLLQWKIFDRNAQGNVTGGGKRSMRTSQNAPYNPQSARIEEGLGLF